MFGLLKDKLAGFVNKLIRREEDKAPVQAPVVPSEPVSSPPKKEEPAPIVKVEPKKIETPKPAQKVAPIISAPKPVEKPAPVISIPQPKPAEKAAPPVFVPEPKPAPKIEPVVSMPAQKPVEKPAPPTPVSEPKKNILSSIWPFGGKKEEKKVPAPQPAPKPIQTSSPAVMPEPKKEGPAPAMKTAQTIAASPAITTAAKPIETAPEIDDSGLARLEKKSMSDAEREMKVRMGLGKSMLGFIAPTVTIEENDVRDLLDELELSLLESDVAVEVSTEVTKRLRSTLVGMKVGKNEMQEEVQRQLRMVLTDVMTSASAFNFLERVQQKPRPVKILFVGPNGAGKTTTMAKIAHLLMEARLSVVFAAGDTFRAAAIEQTEVHAKRLGIPVVKSKYGADPASVAWDAVNYAKAHQTDVVLIDSAGRQDTNANLLDELKKINRVISPDLKIYIGESIGGHALMEQVRAFHEAIGIDGAILTKLDCDAKGGTALSLTHATGVPILYLGTGQGYEDLEKFDADKVAGQILT